MPSAARRARLRSRRVPGPRPGAWRAVPTGRPCCHFLEDPLDPVMTSYLWNPPAVASLPVRGKTERLTVYAVADPRTLKQGQTTFSQA